MRLNYKEANSELINRQKAKRSYAVLKLDKNHVGEIIRLQESLEPVNENEIVLKYNVCTCYSNISGKGLQCFLLTKIGKIVKQ